jgi:hypothetical protein
MERVLVELIHNRDGFCCVVCVCGLDGVYVECGSGRKCVLCWAGQGTKVELLQKLLVFLMFSNALMEKLIPKEGDIFLTFVHIM